MEHLQACAERQVRAGIEETWLALCDASRRQTWWSYLQLDARPGGAFEESWYDDRGQAVRTAGTVVACEPPRRLRLEWADDSWAARTTVLIELAENGPGQTRVRVVHAGWERLPNGTELCDDHERGWQHHLANWARAAESRSQP